MKILIDESLDIRLQKYFDEFVVRTVRDEQWLGLRNGELLNLAIDNAFDIFLTSDKNLKYQQNISNLKIIIILLNSKDNDISSHLPLIPKVYQVIKDINSGILK